MGQTKGYNIDSFWDISSLVPASREIRTKRNNISLTSVNTNEKVSDDNSSGKLTVMCLNTKDSTEQKFDSETSYTPENSLIHNVTLKKRTSSLHYYDDFLKDGEKHLYEEADLAEFVPFFSYVPQYNQLNSEQLKYYIYWRSLVRNNVFEKTDYSYILLYIFELLNLANDKNASEYQERLAKIWNAYHKEYPMLEGKLIQWICDFSLLHKLQPPMCADPSIVTVAPTLKEFFISLPKGDFEACVKTLLKYCTSYDYTTSKFATKENIALFNRYVSGALRVAVHFFSDGENILSKLSNEDSFMTRDAFAGALCTNQIRYSIEIKYCSFSRSNELRYLVGDIVKYAENKIRAHLGIKSRLTVYSISTQLKELLDNYFKNNLLPNRSASAKKEAPQEYDVLYDLPIKPLSLENAMKIEESSWSTTNELVEAFVDEKQDTVTQTIAPLLLDIMQADEIITCDNEEDEVKKALELYKDWVFAIDNNDVSLLKKLSLESGKMIEAVVDEINEIATEVIGDILIEENDNGEYVIIDCYRETII